MEKERGVVEDVEIGRRLAGLRCRLCVMLECGRETTGMVFEHMIEDSKGQCVRKIEIILKCVARCRCLGKVAQEKVVGLYPRLSSQEQAERFRISARTSMIWLLICPANRLTEC